MHPISAGSRDRLLQKIDDETNSLQESLRALRHRRNAIIPISRLPLETLAAIFSILSASAWNTGDDKLSWIRVAHVCHRWREAALNHPRIWSYINFDKLTSAGVAGMLSRAKMAPLYLEADVIFGVASSSALVEQIEAHISHTCHLRVRGYLPDVLHRLVSSAPILEFLSLSHKSPGFALPCSDIPDNLLNCTTPSLTILKLENCNISWKSPLLKRLRTLEIIEPSTEARPKLEDWLDALDEMPQLQKLVLESATPHTPIVAGPLKLEPSRAVTLSSLTQFHIYTTAKDCAFALAHLKLPALTWLHVDVESADYEGEDVHLVISYISRYVHGLQNTEPVQSILVAGEKTRAEVVVWDVPDADIKVSDPDTLRSASVSARFMFAAFGNNWSYGVDTTIFDSLLAMLPVTSVSSFTAQNYTRLNKEFWLDHAPRLHLLERTRLVPEAIKAFKDMLAEDAPPDGPRLPSLTKLILLDVMLTPLRAYVLRDMLIERVEQGVPLRVLDLSTCHATARTIKLLGEVVVDVQRPLDLLPMVEEEEVLSSDGLGPGYGREIEFGNGLAPGYGDTNSDDYDYHLLHVPPLLESRLGLARDSYRSSVLQ